MADDIVIDFDIAQINGMAARNCIRDYIAANDWQFNGDDEESLQSNINSASRAMVNLALDRHYRSFGEMKDDEFVSILRQYAHPVIHDDDEDEAPHASADAPVNTLKDVPAHTQPSDSQQPSATQDAPTMDHAPEHAQSPSQTFPATHESTPEMTSLQPSRARHRATPSASSSEPTRVADSSDHAPATDAAPVAHAVDAPGQLTGSFPKAALNAGPVSRGIVDRYIYSIQWSSEHHTYVGTVLELPGLSWVASTPLQALQGIIDASERWVNNMYKRGEQPPTPYGERVYNATS